MMMSVFRKENGGTVLTQHSNSVSSACPVLDEVIRAHSTKSLRILCNSYSSGKKQMKFASLWGPVQTFVGLLVPN